MYSIRVLRINVAASIHNVVDIMVGKTFFILIVILLLVNVFAKCVQPNLYQVSTTQRPKIAQNISNNNKRQNINIDQVRMQSSSSEYLDTYEYLEMSPKLSSRHTYIAKTNNKKNSNDRIVYPDSSSSEKCDHGLCTNVPDYPKNRIKQILSRDPFIKNYFSINDTFVIDINNRFNSDEISLCETTSHTTYPEKANNTMQQEKIIVNVEGHKQGIVYETCMTNGKCKYSETFPQQYTSYCKQKYIHKKLMVLGEDEKFVFDTFEVPSCCVCILKKSDSN